MRLRYKYYFDASTHPRVDSRVWWVSALQAVDCAEEPSANLVNLQSYNEVHVEVLTFDDPTACKTEGCSCFDNGARSKGITARYTKDEA